MSGGLHAHVDGARRTFRRSPFFHRYPARRSLSPALCGPSPSPSPAINGASLSSSSSSESSPPAGPRRSTIADSGGGADELPLTLAAWADGEAWSGENTESESDSVPETRPPAGGVILLWSGSRGREERSEKEG